MDKKNSRSICSQTAIVILAAGKGTRMGNANMPKVCFKIDGVPAINRLIRSFKRQKFSKFTLVIGSQSEHVMQTVASKHSEVTFVLQSPQLGTGHAARIAAQSLQASGHSGPVLVSMGDKIVEEFAIKLLLECFIRKQADLALLSIPKNQRTQASGGRVFKDSAGNALAIVEKADIDRQAIADRIKAKLKRSKNIKPQQLQKIVNQHLPGKKQDKAIPDIIKLCNGSAKICADRINDILNKDQYNITISGRNYSASEIEKRCNTVNPSLYMMKADVFYTGTYLLGNNNAQQEYYLTDIVAHLANYKDKDAKPAYRICAVDATDDRIIQGFNSPDELLSIQNYMRQKKTITFVSPGQNQLVRKQYHTVSQWLKKLQQPTNSLKKWFDSIYGNHPKLHAQKRKDLVSVLQCYAHNFSSKEKVVIVRAPGRIILMGRHVDHRGGFNNFLAIDRETLVVAGLRQDDKVMAVNTEPKHFKSVEFKISEIIGRFAWSDWLNFVNSDWVRRMLITATGDWGNYIKAAMLRLQHKYHDLKIQGLNIALSGNIPIAAGLSSSSSIVVATLKAAISLNGLELSARQFIDLCGSGEWFVGSRGGSGDHAAIYAGQKGKIVNVGNLPFKINEVVNAPEDYQVVIANSHIKAAKSSQARDAFNEKVCSYNLGLELFKLR